MKVLVTGGCGYKGAKLVPALLDHAHRVTVVDHNWFDHTLTPHPALKVEYSDFQDLALEDLAGFDAVIHLASIANDPSGDLDAKLTWETNVLGANTLCEAMVQAGVPRLIFASSGSVYGVSEVQRVTEDCPLLPLSDYNKTKMIGERVVKSYSDQLHIQNPSTCDCMWDIAAAKARCSSKSFGVSGRDNGGDHSAGWSAIQTKYSHRRHG